MSRAVVATLAAALVLVSLAVSPAVAAPSADGLQAPDRFDATTFRVALSENGSAGVEPGQRMVFEHRTSMVFAAARPAPASKSDPDSLRSSGSITYVGEQSFTSSRPYVELVQPGTQGTATPNTATAGTTPGESMWQFALVLAVLALGVVAAAAWRSGAAGAVLGDDGGTATAPEAETQPETAVDDVELLNDDDRVIELLEENGGRMKQVDIVETTDWSKSKVSMLLSDMEDDGRISKLRVGRENIISLAGEEPDAAGSPFDEE